MNATIDAPAKAKRKRPERLEFLALLVLVFALLNLLRVIETVQEWQLLENLPLSVSPLYLLLSGAIWALVGFILAAGIWWGWRPAWLGTQVACLAYGVYYWLDRWLLAEPNVLAVRWPFMLLLTILFLLFAFASLWLPAGRAYFRR
ncbi:MAG: hypothetical protein JW862_19890 [Anaerolineales bacterium]|nr:hypothetical protein [Anaerolineales bacterium]